MSGMSRDEVTASIGAFLAAPRFVTALTTAAVGTAVFAFVIRQLIGWGGLIGIVATLCVLGLLSLFALRETIEVTVVPVSLLVFLVWAGLSLIWSQYQWSTVGGLSYLGAFTVLGLYIALVRDTIQIVRAFGDVLRVALAFSLALEVLSGLLIDTPLLFLNVLGDLDSLGPIQGITGARNQLGILAVIALVTFGTEFRTRSVQRETAVGSAILAVIALLLTRSPVAFGALIVVCAAAGALYGLRRVKPDAQRFWQVGLLGTAVIAGALAWAFRSPIVLALNGAGDLNYRLELWRRTWGLIVPNTLQGWGWIGIWRTEVLPFPLFSGLGARTATSASNAFVDVWFQLGLVGLVVFVGLVGLAFVRSWLLASRRRSFVFAWPALILVTLTTTALAESSLLVEFGWLTFVVCSVKAAQELGWRRAFSTGGARDAVA